KVDAPAVEDPSQAGSVWQVGIAQRSFWRGGIERKLVGPGQMRMKQFEVPASRCPDSFVGYAPQKRLRQSGHLAGHLVSKAGFGCQILRITRFRPLIESLKQM